MAKKAASLLSEIKGMRPIGRRVDNWFTLLLKRSPEVAAEIDEVLRDFVSGGESASVFKNMGVLYTFLDDTYSKRLGAKNPFLNIHRQAFCYHVKKMRKELNG